MTGRGKYWIRLSNRPRHRKPKLYITLSNWQLKAKRCYLTTELQVIMERLSPRRLCCYEFYGVGRVLVNIWHLSNHLFAQISASDPDLGPSGTVRFSLVPDPNDHYKSFTIDALNGTIYTTASFDREELGLYKLTVRATDQPISGQAR